VSDARASTRGARPSIAVVDYRAGNITSVMKGLAAAGAGAFLTARPEEIDDADAVVIPGVGNFAATGAIPRDVRETLRRCADEKPILGICLGMQFLYSGSDEAPGLEGLELLAGRCRLLQGHVKVPHVGWNTAARLAPSDLLEGIGENPYFYFTHSYAAPVTDATVAVTIHGTEFAAIVADARRVFGVQFHPEKSGEDGVRILRNFVTMC
jgi:glutamine amidotransferase